MADGYQLKLIEAGPEVWNQWRSDHPGAKIDLAGALLHKKDLRGINLSGANLSAATLSETILIEANLSGANLKDADLYCSLLLKADLSKSILTSANLYAAYLREANMTGADVTAANLQSAVLVNTTIEGTIFTNAVVYGISAWDLHGEPKDQSNLGITPPGQAAITVDDLQVAQFVYLLLNRDNLRDVLNTITSKAVLILGRFTPERKIILEAMAHELRQNNLLPIIFDFERPTSRDFTETIKTLAGISLFIVADLTSPSSSPLELQATVPDYQIPFVPILQTGAAAFSMLRDLIGKYDWVLRPVITYSSCDDLLPGFKEAIIDRAWSKHQELQKKKTATIETQSIEDFLIKRDSA